MANAKKQLDVPGVDSKQQERWRTEDDVRTLQRACEIMEDKKRMSAVEEYLEDSQDMLEKMKGYKRGLRRDED